MPITVDTPKGKETLYYSACTPNCWMNCRLYAHVRDGKLVQTSAAPFPDSRYNRICLRGLSHPQRVYSKERLTKPLLRVGKRGENKWKEISWDEAFTLMAEKLTAIKEQYGSQAVLFAPLSGNYAILNGSLAGATHRMANIFGGTLACDSIDLALATGETQVVANLGSGMASWFLGHQPEDIANARTIVAWGTNVTESQVHNWHFFADALEKGATLICIDPRYSETAEKAHYWLRPRPGSDAALAMSMINVVIEENLYDRPYVIEHTVGPFLVRSDNGKFLRSNDLDQNGNESNLVFDEKSHSIVPVDREGIEPALFGSFEARLADGTTLLVRPAFQLLADQAAAYTPEQAEAITSVRPDLVREVSRIYVQNGPAFIYSGMGIDRWDNADMVGRAIATLGVITHQIGKPGATPLGALMGGTAIGVEFTPGILDAWTMPTGQPTARLNFLLTYDAITKGKIKTWVPKDPNNPMAGPRSKEPEEVPYTIKAAIFSCANFASNFPNQNRILNEIFDEKNLEFVVDLEMFMNDTARMCDLVLPITSWFENDDIVGGMHPFMMRQERAIDPIGECKSDFEIYKGLSEKLGLSQYWEKTPQAFIDEIIHNIAQALQNPQIEEDFKRDGVARLMPPALIPLQDGKYMTPSGRAEFYAEGVVVNWPATQPAFRLPVEMGFNPLPHFEPPYEAWHENPKFAKYPLVLNQRHSRFRVHTTYYNVPVLREMDPEPLVEMNEHEMARRGLKDGELVRVYNDRGQAVLKVRTNNAYPDHTCNINKGWQRHQFIAGGYQELTTEHVNYRHYNCSFFDTLVEVEPWNPEKVPPRPIEEQDGNAHIVKGGV